MAQTIDCEYDQNRGNAARPECLLSFAREQNFVIATSRALPWTEPPDGDEDYAVLPIVWIESLIRMAKVMDANALMGRPYFTSCLEVSVLREAIEALIEAGLLRPTDGDEDSVRDFKDLTELQAQADRLTIEKRDEDERLQIDDTKWDDFEPHPAGGPFDWFNAVSVGALTERTKTLEAYVDLSKVLGPRATEAERVQADGQVMVMGGGAAGGQLMALLKGHYLAPAAAALAVTPSFLAYRLPDFLLDTQWPTPLGVELPQIKDYAFDLTLRANWQKASRTEWPALVQGRLGRALEALELLELLFEDILQHPAQLVREVQRLGDAVLPGDQSQKLVFLRLEEIERRLGEQFEGLIREARSESQPAQSTVDKIMALSVAASSKEKEDSYVPGGGDAADGTQPAKLQQIRRAIAEESFAILQRKYLEKMKDPNTQVEDLQLLKDCFKARSVLPKAVLLACPGMRISNYTGVSDFLDFLKDRRPTIRLYLGQCMAYDDDDKCVPAELETFEFDEQQYDLLRSFKWHALDPLNHAILKLKGEEAGTTFATHDVSKLYHHGNLIEQVGEVYGKLFSGIGYPRELEEDEEGLTFKQFMGKIRRLHDHTTGMTPEEVRGMWGLIDEYVEEGFKAAAANAKTIIYAANPADRALRAWIKSTEPVLAKMTQSLKSIKEIRTFRRSLPNVFGNQPQARTLPGFGKRALEKEEGDANKREPGPNKNRKKSDSPRGGDNRTGGTDRSDMAKSLATKEARLQDNPKRVFYYDDGKYSMKQRLVDWPGICQRFGWKPDVLCGPVIMTFSKEKNRDHNCMDRDHRYGQAQAVAHHQCPGTQPSQRASKAPSGPVSANSAARETRPERSQHVHPRKRYTRIAPHKTAEPANQCIGGCDRDTASPQC